MIEITDKTMCSGCHACFSVCPQHCINMVKDEEGFLYPQVLKESCIQCGLCEKACQAISPICSQSSPVAYACYNLDDSIRAQSSSGGIFTLLAEQIIEQGGVVFGAAFNKEFHVQHICVKTVEELEKLRGSKYLQSTIGDAYIEAKAYLEQGRLVLFTGTPCQIDGFLHYLKKSYSNLYTQDIICHGAPSQQIWQQYVNFRESKASSKTQKVFFRDKKYGWQNYVVRFKFENHKEYEQILTEDLFMQGFLANLYLRPSCYHCHSKTMHRNSDITLADFWGVENIAPEMFDDKGTSLVLLHTPKGQQIFAQIKNKMKVQNVDVKEALKYNTAATQSVPLPANRSQVVEEVTENGFSSKYMVYLKKAKGNKYIQFLKRVKNKAKSYLH